MAAAAVHVVVIPKKIVRGHNAFAGHEFLKGGVRGQAPKAHVKYRNAQARSIQGRLAQGHAVEVRGLAAGQQVIVG